MVSVSASGRPQRCELTELLVDQCAHCQGVPDPDAASVHQPQMTVASRAKSLAMHAEDLMLIMNTNRLKVRHRRVGGAFPLSHYDKVEPFSLVGVTHADVSEDHFFRDATPWDLHAPLDIVVANEISSPVLYGEDFGIRRYRIVKRPYLPLQRIAYCMVEASYLAINSTSGIAHSQVTYYGMNRPGDKWVALPPRGAVVVGDGYMDEETELLLGLACGVQFARDYSWRVHLKYNGADIGVMIPTTPEGIRALFKLRDYEPGASRRKALTHWVSGHGRRIHKDTDEEHLVWVRDHLRGRMAFTWQDMRGVIYPSEHDLRRLWALKGGSR